LPTVAQPDIPVRWDQIRVGGSFVHKECGLRFLSSLGYYTRWFSRTMPEFSALADRAGVPLGTRLGTVYPLVWLDVILRGMSQVCHWQGAHATSDCLVVMILAFCCLKRY